MHKIISKPITIDCFETRDYNPSLSLIDDASIGLRVDCFINDLEQLRQKYLLYMKMAKEEESQEKRAEYIDTAKKYWKELIRWLPESWLQTRTWTANYEVIRSIVHQRQEHKLAEWREDFIGWAHSLPYSEELIFYNNAPTAAN